MARNTRTFEDTVRSYGTRGTRVRSAEGSAIGRSRADAVDAKRLAQETVQRISGLRSKA